MHHSVTEESIQRANSLFWEQMLAMYVVPISQCEDSVEFLRCIGSGHVLGACALSGVWNGRIEIRLSRGLALEATGAMLMQPLEQLHESDTLDAAREIANMIAGTLKSALPRPCALSLPSAAIEVDDFCVLPRTQDSVSVFFSHQAGELMVRVWEDGTEGESLCQAKCGRHAANLGPFAEAHLEAMAHAL